MSNSTAVGPSAAIEPALPLTVQLGFAGPRHLLQHQPAGAQTTQQLRAELKAVLTGLRQQLQLGPNRFFTGVSQLAVGADMLFTELLAELDWPQRILLPQPRAEFLSAIGTQGPDFQPAEAEQAQLLFASPHIVEERAVSTAATRRDRFEETNLHILDEADVLVCMVVQGSEPRKGGTSDLVARAVARQKPVLVLTLHSAGAEADTGPLFTQEWRGPSPSAALLNLPHCVQHAGQAVALPADLLPGLGPFVDVVKQAGSQRAGRRRVDFQFAAGVVIGTHVVATLAALLALKLPTNCLWMVALVVLLLAGELALLGWGYLTHRRLHDEHATRDWAMARLCAEVARSARGLRGMPMALDHLRQLPLPPELQALTKTLNVLHLRDNASAAAPDLEALRQRYLQERLRDGVSGQEPYYTNNKRVAHRYINRASKTFGWLSLLAFAATLSKVVILGLALGGGWAVWKEFAGPLAILFPVAAVGVMSMATAMDWDARSHTFADMHLFVQRQGRYIESAASLRELTTLVLQTESRLLGETLNWFGRRAYVGVA